MLRDLVVEKTGARIFARFMEKVQHPTEYNSQVDPPFVPVHGHSTYWLLDARCFIALFPNRC